MSILFILFLPCVLAVVIRDRSRYSFGNHSLPISNSHVSHYLSSPLPKNSQEIPTSAVSFSTGYNKTTLVNPSKTPSSPWTATHSRTTLASSDVISHSEASLLSSEVNFGSGNYSNSTATASSSSQPLSVVTPLPATPTTAHSHATVQVDAITSEIAGLISLVSSWKATPTTLKLETLQKINKAHLEVENLLSDLGNQPTNRGCTLKTRNALEQVGEDMVDTIEDLSCISSNLEEIENGISADEVTGVDNALEGLITASQSMVSESNDSDASSDISASSSGSTSSCTSTSIVHLTTSCPSATVTSHGYVFLTATCTPTVATNPAGCPVITTTIIQETTDYDEPFVVWAEDADTAHIDDVASMIDAAFNTAESSWILDKGAPIYTGSSSPFMSSSIFPPTAPDILEVSMTYSGSAIHSSPPNVISQATTTPNCFADGAAWLSPTSWCDCGSNSTYSALPTTSGATEINCNYMSLPTLTIQPATTSAAPTDIPGVNGVPGCVAVVASDQTSDYCNCGGTPAPTLSATVDGLMNCAYTTQPTESYDPVSTSQYTPPYAPGNCDENVVIWC
ncbi:uncharacterized protein BDV14DRAFT_203840 [Aspergillus stella-maris]|uniref:uncharacterized protein n=1 Tax=Aspergillus stella-maris TaxID=1810926 RepID=UPI003CCDBE87